MQERYESLRTSYKRLEPLIEYLDPQLVAQQVNGAPLPKLDPKSQFVEILEPHGLQVLDELMADTEASSDDIVREMEHVSASLADAIRVVRSAPWTDRMMLECARTGTMRLMSMGLTGFDRPGTGYRREDLLVPFGTVTDIVLLFAPSLSTTDAEQLRRTITGLRSRYARLVVSDFKKLDRMTIIRDVLDPLYATIADVQTALGIEYADQVGPSIPTVDPRARSMFMSTTLVSSATSGLRPQQITPQMIELGRTLFFDPVLSSTRERACASCHKPERAFTDGLKTSVALGRDGYIDRNAPTLINATFSRRFFYDLRAQRVSDVVSHVATNDREFGTSLIKIVGTLRESPDYVDLFERAFNTTGPAAVDIGNVNAAISAYLTTLVSFNSPVDRYLRGESRTLPSDVRRGFNLFMGKALCGTCHFAPTFAGYVPPAFVESESEIIGVPIQPVTAHATVDPDLGRAKGILREQVSIYRHSFKTMTVRNVSLTAPYMHNGAYTTLDQIVDFYDRGGGKGIGIVLAHQTLPFDRLDLTKSDKKDLVAFMKALTDTAGLGAVPSELPRFYDRTIDSRIIGGVY